MAGTVKITWKQHDAVIATGQATRSSAGAVKYSMTLTKAGSKALKKAHKSLKLTAAGAFTLASGGTVKASRVITLQK